MRRLFVIVPLVLAWPSGAQDMAVMQKWAAAKVVKYRVEGVHKARVPVVFGDYEGKGEVTDRVVAEYTWDVGKRRIVGTVTVTDATSEVANLKSDGTHCPPPQLKGAYEHFQSASNALVGDLIQIKGTRTFPAASVSNYPASCSMRAISGSKQDVTLFVGGVGPEVLAMPMPKGGPVEISADRKSYSVKGAEQWVWTYTPTLVR
jgi:hypothetical protein